MKKTFELLNWAEDYLKKRNIANARVDAEILLAAVLKTSRSNFILLDVGANGYSPLLNKNKIKKFRGFITRHGKYEPVAYILGNAEFMGFKFFVTKSVLIPRPETEILVSEAIKKINEKKTAPKILDMGVGSGVIAVSLAKFIKGAEITAVDASKRALKVALKNAEHNGADKRIKFLQSDLFDALKKQKFDAIISNPPYVAKNDFKKISLFVKKFEPLKALNGGAEGLEIIKKIINQAPRYLKPDGFLALEVGFNQARRAAKLMKTAGYKNIAIIKDYASIDRIIIGDWLQSCSGQRDRHISCKIRFANFTT